MMNHKKKFRNIVLPIIKKKIRVYKNMVLWDIIHTVQNVTNQNLWFILHTLLPKGFKYYFVLYFFAGCHCIENKEYSHSQSALHIQHGLHSLQAISAGEAPKQGMVTD